MAWPTPAVSRLIDAMVVAEGGNEAMVRAVQCSLPETKNLAQAREIALNTISHALWDYVIGEHPGEVKNFVYFLAKRRPPMGVANDPTNLNKNWPGNVMAALGTMPAKPKGEA